MTSVQPAPVGTESTPRRGRPKVPGLREARREAIIASAFVVLADKGYHNTSMSDIARHAGTGQGTLYRYFTSKRELLDHVFDYAVQKTIDALDLDELTNSFDNYEQALHLVQKVGARLFALNDADPTLLRLVTVQSSAIDAELRHRVVGLMSAVDGILTPLFAKVVPDEVADSVTDWAPLARMIIGMAGPGLVMSLLDERSPDRRARFVAAAETMVDRGLLASIDSNRHEAPPRQAPIEDPGPARVPPGDRRAQLYAAAVELFVANGYYDVDVAHIVAAVGVGHGTFYNYFPSKRAVLESIQRAVEADFTAALSGPGDSETLTCREDFIAEFTDRIARGARYIATNAALMEFVTLTAAGVDDSAFRLALDAHRRIGARISELLELGRERGWVRRDVDLEFAGQAAIDAVGMAVLPVLLGEADTFDSDSAARACSIYLLSGMRGLTAST